LPCSTSIWLFHLNLAFSSIEEDQARPGGARLLWAVPDLAAQHGPIGIEATACTLQAIRK
jgi:hypothetical protein